jgi:hypothetical protein
VALVAVLALLSPAASVSAAGPAAQARDDIAASWPQEITGPEGTIVLYQPQPEKLEGNLITGRAAFSLEAPGREPIFGAMWYEARLAPGSDDGHLLVRDARVTRVAWPDSTEQGEERFTGGVEEWIAGASMEISRERLAASLATADREKRSLDLIRNDPPKIEFRDHLAVLLLYDGEPQFGDIEGSDYERALNTPFAVARRKGGGRLFLSSGAFWYQAQNPLGPWTPTNSPPQDLVAMMPPPDEEQGSGPSTPPQIVVATRPTELISTDGRPEWQALVSGELLYVVNTETPWLRLISTNQMFVLLSGRWFTSTSQSGPWEFVRGDSLPNAFQGIAPESEIGGVRTSIAGTDEADQATLEAQLPQVTAINRSEASLTVEYAGEPRFEPLPGTSVSYAVNTGAQVLLINGRYYAVDNAVWFTSASATGPWVVADSVPQAEIAEIPPSSPVYNTTYVQVYDSTPDVVYVGYTPGYMWSFPYYGVPIYGTGWYYPPYFRPGFYYPRPPTWGFHVGYNPWTGWSFGVSWSRGFFSFGVSWGGGWRGPYRPWGCCGGWYGGGYRRGPTIINTGNINIGNTINVGNRNNIGNRIGNDARFDNPRASRNLYDRPTNRARNADRATAQRNLKQARPAANRANDVFADRNGNVARRTGETWQTRDNGAWRDASANRAQTPRASTRPQLDRSGLNRDLNARQAGARRETAARSGARSRGGARRR